MPGPQPTDPAILAARGSWRGKKRLRERQRSAQRPPAGPPPRCPTWLDSEAKAEWRRVVPTLHEMREVHPLDVDVLAVLCTTWSQWRAAEAHRQAAETDPDRQAAERDMTRLSRQWLALARECAITPLSRARLGLEALVPGTDAAASEGPRRTADYLRLPS